MGGGDRPAKQERFSLLGLTLMDVGWAAQAIWRGLSKSPSSSGTCARYWDRAEGADISEKKKEGSWKAGDQYGEPLSYILVVLSHLQHFDAVEVVTGALWE